ncbi:MAG: hypothetical protein HC799_12475 [Limnothrix sp. RL_2_0]|nr:hypothetical protein [Limnothrix sp. RL_2_0]
MRKFLFSLAAIATFTGILSFSQPNTASAQTGEQSFSGTLLSPLGQAPGNNLACSNLQIGTPLGFTLRFNRATYLVCYTDSSVAVGIPRSGSVTVYGTLLPNSSAGRIEGIIRLTSITAP